MGREVATHAEDCTPYMAAPAQILAYHFVIGGRLVCEIEGEDALEVGAGEVLLLPRNDSHDLASATGLTPIKADGLIQAPDGGGLARISHGGGGEETYLVCGFLASDDIHNPLIATLPRMLKLDIRRGASRDWVEASVRFAARELAAGRFASSEIMSRLSELLFVEAVRDYAASLDGTQSGWLAGLNDRQIGQALALLARTSRGPLDDRQARRRGVDVAQCLRRPLHLAGRPAAHQISHPMANSASPGKNCGVEGAALRRSPMPSAMTSRSPSIGPSSANSVSRRRGGGTVRSTLFLDLPIYFYLVKSID